MLQCFLMIKKKVLVSTTLPSKLENDTRSSSHSAPLLHDLTRH